MWVCKQSHNEFDIVKWCPCKIYVWVVSIWGKLHARAGTVHVQVDCVSYDDCCMNETDIFKSFMIVRQAVIKILK